MKVYDIVYLLSSILGMYARYKFIFIFYETDVRRKKRDFIQFGLFYIVVSGVYLLFDIPVLTLFVNFFGLFVISMTYDRNIKRALMMNFIVLGLLFAIESIVVFITGYVLTSETIVSKADYSSILGIVCINALFYIIVNVAEKFKNIKKGFTLHISYWIALITTPIGSFYFLILIMRSGNLRDISLVIVTSLALAMNFVTFVLYDIINDYYIRKEAENILKQLNQDYKKQLEIMKSSMNNIRSFQHDLNRHLHTFKTLAESEDTTKVLNYLNIISHEIQDKTSHVNTGNIVIDSIMNFELSMIDEKDVDLQLDIGKIPNGIKIEDYDLTVIFSNILSNAIEAIKYVDKKRIHIFLKFDRGLILFSVLNTFDGKLTEKEGKLLTRKRNNKIHGIGLSNVKNVLKYYNGDMIVGNEANQFNVKVMFYV